jgi:hypothetical protein
MLSRVQRDILRNEPKCRARSGNRMRDAGCGVRGTGYGMRDARDGIRDAGCVIRNA